MLRMIGSIVLLVAAACSSVPTTSAGGGGAADLVLIGGRVFTADPEHPWAEAVAIRGDRFIAVGTDEEIRQLAGGTTRIIPLEGRLVIPGINDAHVHAPWIPTAGASVDIPSHASADQAISILREAAAHELPGVWITAELPLPLIDAEITREILDEALPQHPVLLSTLGGHAGVLNSAGLREWRISDSATDPPGGHYGRDGDRLNGWVYEQAYWAPQQARIADATDAELTSAIRAFEAEAVRFGITSVQTMSVVPPMRLEALLGTMGPALQWRVIDFRMAPYAPAAESLFPVKYILDGTPVERGAAFRQPYADLPASAGQLNYSREEIDSMVRDAAAGRAQLLVHAAGDAAAAEILDAIRRNDDGKWPGRRVRLEHGDGLAPDLVPLAQRYGVVVVQNPSHLMLPEVIGSRLGPQRSRAFAPMASLWSSGVHFALGSDGPLNPFLNMMFAAMHPGNPNEALTVERALLAYTRGSAYAELREHTKGAIAPGMVADLAVLSQDIFEAPLEALPATESVLTIVGGRVVWEGE